MGDFLFARPSILDGVGRNLDLFGIMQVYNRSETTQEADRRAFEADMGALRKDAQIAFDMTRNKYESFSNS